MPVAVISIVLKGGMAQFLSGALTLSFITICALPLLAVRNLWRKRGKDQPRMEILDNEVAGLRRQLDAAQRRNDNLKEILLERVRKECGKLLSTKEVENAVLQVQDLLDMAEEAEARVLEVEAKMEAICLENQSLQRKALEDQQALANHQKEILELRESQVAEKNDLLQNKKDITELKRQNASKQEKLLEYERKIQELQKEMAGKNEQIEGLLVQDTNKQMELDELRKKLEAKAKESVNCNEIKEQFEKIAVEKQREICELRREIEDRHSDIYKLVFCEKEVQCLKRELEEKQLAFDELVSQNERNEKNLIEKVREKQKEIDKLRKDVEDREKEMDMYFQKEKEMNDFKEELKDKILLFDRILSLNERHEKVVVEKQKEINELKKQLEDKDREMDRRIQYEKLNKCGQITGKEDKVDPLEEELGEKEQHEIEELLKELKKKQREIEELSCQNLRQEDELQTKQKEVELIKNLMEQDRAQHLEYVESCFKEINERIGKKITEMEVEVFCLREEVQQKNRLLKELGVPLEILNEEPGQVEDEKGSSSSTAGC
ncbi:repetitive organellar protein-like [Macrobrachium nipponense]|uniref:repetitive organellar protein-like n=1 Tax=Macrobrachium nipponense TaxID=159736 RepID=UPI0030C8C577